MDTKEMSSSLAKIAFSFANQIPSSACLEGDEALLEMIAQKPLEPDELAALSAFLSERHQITNLISSPDEPPTGNNWWG